MKTFIYFAYGSNMLTEWLQDRCQSAQAINVAFAAGYDLEFSKRSKDKSGKATLVEVSQPRRQAYGVLFKIGNSDLCALDRAEGRGYKRFDKFSVTVLPDREQAQLKTYIASASARADDDSLKPYDWYLALVICGAIQHKLPEAYISSLRDIAFIPDPKTNRKTRENAIIALGRAGVADYTQMLSSHDTI